MLDTGHNVAHPCPIRNVHHQITAALGTAELSQLKLVIDHIDKNRATLGIDMAYRQQLESA